MTQGKILLAFPGMGKTTVCKEVPGLVDLDYGYFRSALERSLNGEEYSLSKVNSIVQHLTKIYTNEGFVVLTNEPMLIPWLKQLNRDIFMILPNMEEDLGKRILVREVMHPVNSAWAKQYAKDWRLWVQGWERMADKYGIRIIRAKFLYEDWNFIKKEVNLDVNENKSNVDSE